MSNTKRINIAYWILTGLFASCQLHHKRLAFDRAH